MPKPRILMLAGYYLPGYKAGGALRAIANVVASLGEEFNFLVLAYDRDLGDRNPYQATSYAAWMPVGNAQIRHIKPGVTAFPSVRRAIADTPHDLLYINSFFDPVFGFSMIEATNAPVLAAPNGQFKPSALSQKALKKRALLAYLRRFQKMKRVIWQAGDQSEAEDIFREFPSTRREDIEICPILLAPPPREMPPRPKKNPGQLRIAFVSRISPIKNLLFAIQSLKSVTPGVVFSIYGPIEDAAYWAECEKAIAALPTGITVKLEGPVPHSQVNDVLSREHLFYMPTFGESFGYVIYESLCAGCPVLISDQTPWRQMESKGAGWDIPLDTPERFSQVIRECAEKDERAFSEMSEAAWRAAVDHYQSNSRPDSYCRAFTRLIPKGAAA